MASPVVDFRRETPFPPLGAVALLGPEWIGWRMSFDTDSVDHVIQAVDLAGVFANAVLGGVAARSARLDLVGFVVLAIMSGLGGGLIRDTLLQNGTPLALADPTYLGVAILGGVIAFLVAFNGRWSRRGLLLLDALAVGCWSAVGVQKGLDAGLSWTPAIMLGIITAVGGGMVRDISLLKVPTIFGGGALYATSALLAGVEMAILSALGFVTLGFVVAIVSGAALLLVSMRYDWMLPTGYSMKIPKPLLRLQPRGWRRHE